MVIGGSLDREKILIKRNIKGKKKKRRTRGDWPSFYTRSDRDREDEEDEEDEDEERRGARP